MRNAATVSDPPQIPPVALDELYHCNSKHGAVRLAFISGRQMRRRDRTVHALYEASKNRFKAYTAAARVDLPRDCIPLDLNLGSAILGRRSRREFTSGSPSPSELGTLLARSYGICGVRHEVTARAVPSGGGLYPLDVYVLQFPDGGIDEGVYHYHVGGHRLQRVSSRCDRRILELASIYPEIIARAALLLAVVADMPRTRAKYGERAYRLALLEAGHVSQNLYLVAQALGLGLVALDGFYDDKVHAVLDLDGVSEIVLLLFAVGRVHD
ncbi:MAG: SagB/ThcOx family dehydrogenase [Deltaproteobacteria bacterium]|nr:SagB/ThcOx family dehydrogenase [Deltaproteobacteria bacterium]